MSFSTDEIVVADEHQSAPTQVVQGFQFGNDLAWIFVPGVAAVKVDDVAEIAVKGAALGGLDAHGDIVVKLDQVKPGNWGSGHLRFAVFDHASR